MNLSKFGKKFTQPTGITQLMEDLGNANNSGNPDIVMLGGGNPALIPESNDLFVKELQALISSSKVDSMLGLYDGPLGFDEFREALADMLNDHYGWGLDANNIALSNGSQSNFFSLFNLLAGEMTDGSNNKILFPLAPEYVGYADQGLSDDMFVSIKPKINILENDSASDASHSKQKQFKYEIDFDVLEETLAETHRNIGAICVSRPTNPTGNVITNDELSRLDALAQQYQIPLIIDNAYGHPFPGAIYIDAKLTWNPNTILCMSLSKLGLPGLRTGIVIANHDIINALSRINGVMILAPNSVGPTLMTRMIKDKELLNLCRNVIKPFYEDKAATAVRVFDEVFADQPVYLHKLEGAFFMWLWFKDMDITGQELYTRLKREDVYIIPGHNFFIGIEDDWEHKHQCIRINYAKDEATLRKGLEAIHRIITS
ncbi:valine--pyruvate transaminase [Cocleimonas flava]|uniref:Valine-pyruvate aminotransferase n=1 Tax=Cocleimonas flava TaxID=634765 RepID=A0A4R1F414_9GAMM|nr:valine--pyruvate transaminase [Cocleimonas flava]TCJ87304.1 valine-pyruvate aminotransferase [Cocleimonas flava]